MDKLNICFIVLSLFIFGSVTVANGDGGLKSEKPAGETAPLAYQIKLYDGSCLQYDRITKSVTGVPCDSYCNKQQFRDLPVDVEGRHENATSPKAAKIGTPENSAFKEHRIPNQNNQLEGNNHIIWKRLDFGQSGASHVALKLKSAEVLSNLNGKVSVQVGDAPSVLLDPEAKEASNSTEENVLNFDLKTLNGTQDVILSLPSELSLSDIVSVHFKKAISIDPTKNYIVAWKKFTKVLTIDAINSIAYVRNQSVSSQQEFKFVKAEGGLYQIIVSSTGEALEVQEDFDKGPYVIAQPLGDALISQSWSISQSSDKYVFKSEYYAQCLTVAETVGDSRLRIKPCEDQDDQLWQLVEQTP